jgi:hypothetical protein
LGASEAGNAGREAAAAAAGLGGIGLTADGAVLGCGSPSGSPIASIASLEKLSGSNAAVAFPPPESARSASWPVSFFFNSRPNRDPSFAAMESDSSDFNFAERPRRQRKSGRTLKALAETRAKNPFLSRRKEDALQLRARPPLPKNRIPGSRFRQVRRTAFRLTASARWHPALDGSYQIPATLSMRE